MSKRKQWWIWEVVQWLAIGVAVIVIPEMPFWKYVVLGVCFGAYAVFYRKQSEL